MILGFLYIIESIQEPAGISKDGPERSDQGRARVTELQEPAGISKDGPERSDQGRARVTELEITTFSSVSN